MRNIHRIDLLERLALRLNHTKIYHKRRRQVARRKYIPIPIIDRRRDERREKRDQEVEQPIRRRRERHALGAVLARIDLADQSPDNGTPSNSVASDEKRCEDDHDRAAGFVVRRVHGRRLEDEMPDGREHHEAHEHPQRAADERFPPAVVLHDVEAEEGHAEVDAAEDQLRHVAVRQPHGFEDRGPVVEEEIRARELLQRLHGDAQQGTVAHARAGEDGVPGRAVGLLLEFLLDFFELAFHGVVVLVHAVEFRHGLARFVDAAVAVGVAGGFGEEEDAYAKDEGPEEGDPDGDAP